VECEPKSSQTRGEENFFPHLLADDISFLFFFLSLGSPFLSLSFSRSFFLSRLRRSEGEREREIDIEHMSPPHRLNEEAAVSKKQTHSRSSFPPLLLPSTNSTNFGSALAAAGLAAALLLGDAAPALAASRNTVSTGQGELLNTLIAKNSKGVKVVKTKSPISDTAAAQSAGKAPAVIRSATKQAASSKPKAAASSKPAKAPANNKKTAAPAFKSTSAKVTFGKSGNSKSSSQGAAATPKAVIAAPAPAPKGAIVAKAATATAATATAVTTNAVNRAAVPKAAPKTFTLSAPSLPKPSAKKAAAPSAAGAGLPSLSLAGDTTEALAVAAAEFAAAGIASSVVGGILSSGKRTSRA
jgi:hypothetical protein